MLVENQVQQSCEYPDDELLTLKPNPNPNLVPTLTPRTEARSVGSLRLRWTAASSCRSSATVTRRRVDSLILRHPAGVREPRIAARTRRSSTAAGCRQNLRDLQGVSTIELPALGSP